MLRCLTVVCLYQCDAPYHLGCLDPPLSAVPDGEWFCPGCEQDPGAPIVIGAVKKPAKGRAPAKSAAKSSSSKRQVEEESDLDDDDEDEEDEEPSGKKRKASSKAKASGKHTQGLWRNFLIVNMVFSP